MVTATLVLSVIDTLLKLTLTMVDKMTPEQVQGFVERHEKRMEFFEKILEKAKWD